MPAHDVADPSEGPLVIFDCNGVLVDSDPIAAPALAAALKRVGVEVSAETVTRRFQGRRPADVFAAVAAATGKRLPVGFASAVAADTPQGLRGELGRTAYV